MSSKDSQNQRGRGLRGFLPGASGPDGNLTTSPSNTGHQVWQPPRPLPGSIPPGLEYLSQLDLIIIHQQVEILGMILGTETTNKYEIKNSLGQRIYFAVEESLCFNRTFCSTLRSCILRVSDNSGQEVITVHRPLRCNSCWCPCYLQELEIEAPPGTLVAYVAQKWDPFRPKFTIQNANREDILKIVGPCATCSCFGDVNFEVRTMNEKLTIGKISKYWSGFVNGVFTNADNFGIHIPADLDVTLKAAMMGACFLFIFIVKEIFPSAIIWNDCTIQIMPQTSSQGTVQWVRSTGSISKNHPPELDCLTEVNQLLICQRFDLLRVLSLVANSKTYEVVNNQGERIFFAEESSNCFIRHLCGPSRPFTITFYDNSGREVISMHKTIGCRCCWSNCYLQKLKVQAPPGETIGYVYQYFHPFLANFKIMNKKKESVMVVRGPCVISSCLKNLKFDLFYLDEEMGVGIISQQWAEFIREPVSHLGKFGIQFPFNLDVKIKALVLGASFLIDCMYFEIWS